MPHPTDYNQLKQLDLVNILTTRFGWSIQKEKGRLSPGSWLTLSRETEKILIKNNPNAQGHWIFTNLGTDQSGTIIDYLIDIEGFCHETINSYFSGQAIDLPKTPKKQNLPPQLSPHDQQLEAERKLQSFPTSQKKCYLRMRSICPQVIQYFGVLSNESGMLVPMYEFVGEGCDSTWELVTTQEVKLIGTVNGKPKWLKLFQKGRKRGAVCHLLEKEAGETRCLYICESIIECLSLETIRRRTKFGQPHYLSACGRVSQDQLECIHRYITYLAHLNRCKFHKTFTHGMYPHQLRVCIALNNDQPGRDMTRQLYNGLKTIPNIDLEICYPKLKDWNDQLLQINNTLK